MPLLSCYIYIVCLSCHFLFILLCHLVLLCLSYLVMSILSCYVRLVLLRLSYLLSCYVRLILLCVLSCYVSLIFCPVTQSVCRSRRTSPCTLFCTSQHALLRKSAAKVLLFFHSCKKLGNFFCAASFPSAIFPPCLRCLSAMSPPSLRYASAVSPLCLRCLLRQKDGKKTAKRRQKDGKRTESKAERSGREPRFFPCFRLFHAHNNHIPATAPHLQFQRRTTQITFAV